MVFCKDHVFDVNRSCVRIFSIIRFACACSSFAFLWSFVLFGQECRRGRGELVTTWLGGMEALA